MCSGLGCGPLGLRGDFGHSPGKLILLDLLHDFWWKGLAQGVCPCEEILSLDKRVEPLVFRHHAFALRVIGCSGGGASSVRSSTPSMGPVSTSPISMRSMMLVRPSSWTRRRVSLREPS